MLECLFIFISMASLTPTTNKQQDVICPEAVKLEDLDSAAIQSQFEKAKAAFAAASAGSLEQAQAQVDMEVNRAMGLAVGMSLA